MMIGITRGIATLIGFAVAGFLVWSATQIGTETAGEYWATYGLVAAAGLAIALSQIVGGWTKWGWPRLSAGVFLLGFLPALVAGGWILLAHQPADYMNTSNWSSDIGIRGLVEDLGAMLPALALLVGLALGLTFDTAGPRTETVVADRPEPMAAPEKPEIVHHDGADVPASDEPLTAERDEVRRSRFRRRQRAGTGGDL